MKSAPDRIIPTGLAVRAITAAYSWAALALRSQRGSSAVLAAVTAVASSYIGWKLRRVVMGNYGQTPPGLVEDALVVGSGLAVARLPEPNS